MERLPHQLVTLAQRVRLSYGRLTPLNGVQGLLEGEGYFGSKTPEAVTIRCQMTDEDVLIRLRKCLGVGTILDDLPKSHPY